PAVGPGPVQKTLGGGGRSSTAQLPGLGGAKPPHHLPSGGNPWGQHPYGHPCGALPGTDFGAGGGNDPCQDRGTLGQCPDPMVPFGRREPTAQTCARGDHQIIYRDRKVGPFLDSCRICAVHRIYRVRTQNTHPIILMLSGIVVKSCPNTFTYLKSNSNRRRSLKDFRTDIPPQI